MSQQFKHLDFVKFHTPVDDNESKEIYLVVDDEECAGSDEVKSLKVMEIHQTLPLPCVNTFVKADFELFYRPTEEEKLQIKNKSFKLSK